jgi:hypothetical protein
MTSRFKPLTRTALVGLAAAGAFAIAVPAHAQPAPRNSEIHRTVDGMIARHVIVGHMDRHMDHHGPRGGFDFIGSPQAVEIALVRLSYAIDMTGEQQALFETLRNDALAAATAFEDTTEGLRPNPEATGMPDIADMLDTRIAIETAKLEALTAVQPAFEAFFGSLTDEQKAELMPRRHRVGPRIDAPAEPAPDAPANG